MYRYEWQIPLLFFLGSICTISALYQREPYFILTASFTINGMPALPALFSPINFASFSLTIDLSDEEKSVCVRRHQKHLNKTKAKRECYVYKPVKRLKKILRQLNRNLTSTKTETNCSLETKMHYSFDYAQQVHIPSNPMQRSNNMRFGKMTLTKDYTLQEIDQRAHSQVSQRAPSCVAHILRTYTTIQHPNTNSSHNKWTNFQEPPNNWWWKRNFDVKVDIFTRGEIMSHLTEYIKKKAFFA